MRYILRHTVVELPYRTSTPVRRAGHWYRVCAHRQVVVQRGNAGLLSWGEVAGGK